MVLLAAQWGTATTSLNVRQVQQCDMSELGRPIRVGTAAKRAQPTFGMKTRENRENFSLDALPRMLKFTRVFGVKQ